MWGVLKPCSVQHQYLLCVIVEPSNWAKVAIPSLVKYLSAHVYHLQKSFSPRSSVNGSFEELKI